MNRYDKEDDLTDTYETNYKINDEITDTVAVEETFSNTKDETNKKEFAHVRL